MKAWMPGLRRAILVALGLGCSAVGAYTVEPSLVSLRSSGSDSSTFFRLQNKTSKPTAIEITINEHRKDVDGNTVAGAAADDDFIVFPAQLVMVPGDEASVQVRWIGEGALPAERAYTLVTREVAVPRAMPVPEVTSGVRIGVTVLVNYEARIYVTPAGARPRLVVESVADAVAEPPALEVVLANEGTAHQVLADANLLLVPSAPDGSQLRQQAVRLALRDLPGTRAHLLAGERRRLRIPRPASFPAGRVHVLLAQ